MKGPNVNLSELLIRQKPREVSGARSANRFEFQKSWALLRLLDLHRSEQDYVIIFDYHDDVLVLDCCNNPNAVEFYQIKTKASGNWTKTELTKRPKGKTPLPSILGKLVGNKIYFPSHTKTLTFISNQAFKLSTKEATKGTVQELCLSAIDDTDLKDILQKLQVEHGLDTPPDCSDCTFLKVTSLSLNGHTDQAMGALATFLGELYPNGKVLLPAIYQALSGEIRRKTNVEGLPTDFEHLRASRGISRADFQQFLQDVKPSDQFSELMRQMTSQLQTEGVAFDEVRKITVACRQYEIDRMDGSNSVVRDARKAIEMAVQKVSQTGMPSKLREALRQVRDLSKLQTPLLPIVKSSDYESAMILMAIYGI